MNDTTKENIDKNHLNEAINAGDKALECARLLKNVK